MANAKPRTTHAAGTWPMAEIRFSLPDLAGNPFDYVDNDVRVTVRKPNGVSVSVPAFFDGGDKWRIRFTPDLVGKYGISVVSRNGKRVRAVGLAPSTFTRTGPPSPGFIRRDAQDAHRFVFDNGDGYYPIGNNVAWDSSEDLTVAMLLPRMGDAGENWSRVWMAYWDRLNLDWLPKTKIPLGSLDLTVAASWDKIVLAAEKAGIHFQMTLQHHGPYSTRTDSNWQDNPWNAANGGFLATPEEFFTSPRAKALTKAKYRYIIARWGYSPSVMAWELFNEVQWTDAVVKGHQADVAEWHDEMAEFIRRQDPYHHLITSSFNVDPEVLGTHLDYWQPHDYAPDPISTAAKLNGSKLDRPSFIGEIGPPDGVRSDDGAFLHRALWASMMSDASGAAQYWSWDQIDRQGFYKIYKSATAFAKWAGIASRGGLAVKKATVESAGHSQLSFGPGAGWAKAKQTEFTVERSGNVAGLGSMPSFLQGDYHRDEFPSATFHVDYPEDGAFAVNVGTAAKAGARLEISVDGVVAQTQTFPPAPNDSAVNASFAARVSAGPHTILLKNTGSDWLTINGLVLNPYAPELGLAAKGGPDFAIAWIYSRGAARATGVLKMPGLTAGTYEIAWWDTDNGVAAGKSRVRVASDGVLSCATPAVARDIAVRIVRSPAGNP